MASRPSSRNRLGCSFLIAVDILLDVSCGKGHVTIILSLMRYAIADGDIGFEGIRRRDEFCVQLSFSSKWGNGSWSADDNKVLGTFNGNGVGASSKGAKGLSWERQSHLESDCATTSVFNQALSLTCKKTTKESSCLVIKDQKRFWCNSIQYKWITLSSTLSKWIM